MNKSRIWLNIGIAVAVYIYHVLFGQVSDVVACSLAFIVFWILQIVSVLLGWTETMSLSSFSYKAEFIVELDVDALLTHAFVQDRFETAREKLSFEREARRERLLSQDFYREAHENGISVDGWLRKIVSMRFVIINGLFWSDVHKTFKQNINFDYRIFGSEDEDRKAERAVNVAIRDGGLEVRWDLEGGIDLEESLIARFPLFIFWNLSWHRIGVLRGKELEANLKQDFFQVRKKARKTGKIDLKIVRKILAKYGFEGVAEHEADSSSVSHRSDLSDVFNHYRSKYMAVRFCEIGDDS